MVSFITSLFLWCEERLMLKPCVQDVVVGYWQVDKQLGNGTYSSTLCRGLIW